MGLGSELLKNSEKRLGKSLRYAQGRPVDHKKPRPVRHFSSWKEMEKAFVGSTLRKYRCKHLRSTEYVAKYVGVLKQTYIDWEEGFALPNGPNLFLACDLLRIPKKKFARALRLIRLYGELPEEI